MLSPGTSLGPYVVLEIVGAGGMGEVYRARDSRLGRLVAVKVLPEASAARAEIRRRFKNEARVIASLNHPHICTLYDLGSAGDIEYLVMEYVEGRTLAVALKEGPLPVPLALTHARAVADALITAHDAGVLHRDLKPANLMITPEGKIKVLDFGIAKRLAVAGMEETFTVGVTGTSEIVGTVEYMPPEVLLGLELDARSDIWSFGATLYEMLTGKTPFPGRTSMEVVAAVLHQPHVPLSAEFSKPLRAFIARCLERDSAKRFPVARDLLATLDSLKIAQPRASSGSRVSSRIGTRDLSTGTEQSQVCASTGAPASVISEATEYFEKGILFIWARPDLRRAREMFEKSLALDANFAEAHAAYALTSWAMIEQGHSSERSWLYEAEERLHKAIEINPNSGLAHYALAAVFLFQGNKELAPEEVDRALQAKPPRPTAVHWLAHYHRLNGNFEAAAKIWTGLLQHEPLFWPARVNYADVLLQAGETAKAVREHEKFLEQAPENVFAFRGLARAYMSLNDLQSAAAVLERVRPEDRENYHIRMSRTLLAALDGRRDEAYRAINEDLLRFPNANAFRTIEAVELFSVLGETARALEWLDRTLRNGDERMEWFRRDPLLANIRNDSRFLRIFASMDQRRTPHGQLRRKNRAGIQ